MASELESLAACYQGFDPIAYLQHNYTPPRADFKRHDSIVPWKLAHLHRAFTEGDISGGLLVDIGSGPTLYQVLSGCEVFDKVILTDFLEVNRQELKRWLQDKDGSNFDWSPFLKHVCQLEGRDPSAWKEKAARLRQVVRGIFPVDVHSPQPLAPSVVPPGGADCLVSCFCLESASPDLATFSTALGNIQKLLRSGGHLLLIGTLEMSYYLGSADLKIPTFPVTEAEICASLKDNGFTLIRLEVFTLFSDMKVGADDAAGVFFVKAKKN
ncbi:phenylethanolamine N-methyltransferase [Thalassophryne amazonica]|uniref:phenylethanolamine N-methyltransferase n=1 Tax=Thalassophryne amazonica TaxID=390379 RepID=UPI0014719B5D|nr:phenylethanolamine N-methyltransferase [Thalassophryne amazonica]